MHLLFSTSCQHFEKFITLEICFGVYIDVHYSFDSFCQFVFGITPKASSVRARKTLGGHIIIHTKSRSEGLSLLSIFDNIPHNTSHSTDENDTHHSVSALFPTTILVCNL